MSLIKDSITLSNNDGSLTKIYIDAASLRKQEEKIMKESLDKYFMNVKKLSDELQCNMVHKKSGFSYTPVKDCNLNIIGTQFLKNKYNAISVLHELGHAATMYKHNIINYKLAQYFPDIVEIREKLIACEIDAWDWAFANSFIDITPDIVDYRELCLDSYRVGWHSSERLEQCQEINRKIDLMNGVSDET